MAPAELVVMCLFGEKVSGWWGANHGVRGSVIAVRNCALSVCVVVDPYISLHSQLRLTLLCDTFFLCSILNRPSRPQELPESVVALDRDMAAISQADYDEEMSRLAVGSLGVSTRHQTRQPTDMVAALKDGGHFDMSETKQPSGNIGRKGKQGRTKEPRSMQEARDIALAQEAAALLDGASEDRELRKVRWRGNLCGGVGIQHPRV